MSANPFADSSYSCNLAVFFLKIALISLPRTLKGPITKLLYCTYGTAFTLRNPIQVHSTVGRWIHDFQKRHRDIISCIIQSLDTGILGVKMHPRALLHYTTLKLEFYIIK